MIFGTGILVVLLAVLSVLLFVDFGGEARGLRTGVQLLPPAPVQGGARNPLGVAGAPGRCGIGEIRCLVCGALGLGVVTEVVQSLPQSGTSSCRISCTMPWGVYLPGDIPFPGFPGGSVWVVEGGMRGIDRACCRCPCPDCAGCPADGGRFPCSRLSRRGSKWTGGKPRNAW